MNMKILDHQHLIPYLKIFYRSAEDHPGMVLFALIVLILVLVFLRSENL